MDSDAMLLSAIYRLREDQSPEIRWLLRGLEEFRRQNGAVPLCIILGLRKRGQSSLQSQQKKGYVCINC